jgi:hypothetical protein
MEESANIAGNLYMPCEDVAFYIALEHAKGMPKTKGVMPKTKEDIHISIVSA